MKIECAHDELVPIGTLRPHPKNPNSHSKKQIELLAKILDYQGWRHPIVVSKTTNLICAGHGRLAAALLNGWTEVPVDFQEFENEQQELLYLISDNKIAEISDNDPMLINDIAASLGEFDLDLLGIPEFQIGQIGTFEEIKEKELDENIETKNECPSCSYVW